MQVAEIVVGVHGDVACGQKTGIKIFRGELERRARIIFNNNGDVARARGFHRPFHAAKAMIVRGDGKRPALDFLVVAEKQFCRGGRRKNGVAPFVDEVIDF